MLKQASLIESSQSVYSSLEQAQLLHVIVYIELFLDLFSALGEDLSKLRNLAQDRAKDGLKDQNKPVAAIRRHIDSLLGYLASLGKEHFWIFSLHYIDRLGLLISRWVNLEQVPHNGKVHEPGNPELKEEACNKDESNGTATAKRYDIDEENSITSMHGRLEIVRSLEENLALNRRIQVREGIRSRLDALINADPLYLFHIFQLRLVLIILSLLLPEFVIGERHET